MGTHTAEPHCITADVCSPQYDVCTSDTCSLADAGSSCSSDGALNGGAFEPLLQSSTEQWGLHFAQGSAAVYWCWVSAELYEEQTFIGVIALAQACCEPFSQSRTEQWGLQFAQGSAAVYWLGHC